MRPRIINIRSRMALALAGIACCCLAISAAAAEEKFRIDKVMLQLPEFPPTEAYLIRMNDTRITFIPPQESIVLADSKTREVRLSSRDGQCLILLRPSTVDPKLAAPESWEELRRVVQARFPKEKVGAGRLCFSSAGDAGCAFDLERMTAFGAKIITRLAFVPTEEGMLEVSMSAVDENFGPRQYKFNSFLNSLRVSKTVAESSEKPASNSETHQP